jgi:ribose transport system permease protein
MRRNGVLLRIGLLLILCLSIYILNPSFGKLGNLINILRQGALLYILAIGMTIVILTGGIDLSNGSVLALSSCVAAMAMKSGAPILVVILIALAIGMACGFANGMMVAYMRIPPFIATFAMMYFARGLAYVLLQGKIIYGFEKSFRFIGAGDIIGVPMPVIISIFLLLVFQVILAHTSFGMNIYAIGSNSESSRLLGINVKRVTVAAYVLSGFLSALAGIIYTARLDTAEPVVGASFPLDAIGAVIIGGASILGGEGNLLGSAIGVFILTIIMNGMNLIGISSLWQEFVIGSVILVMITIQIYMKDGKIAMPAVNPKDGRK